MTTDGLSTCDNCYAGYDPDTEGDDGLCDQCAWSEEEEADDDE